MKKTPLVSIITPSYNQVNYLEGTIQSVLNQTYTNLEYIIIDGGSTDGSIEIIKKYEDKLSVWVSESDQGQSDAINKGFQLANGEIQAWINSDDLYYPNAVEDAVDCLIENPQVGMVYGDTDLMDETGQMIGKFKARQTDNKRLMQGYVDIPQPAAFWRRSLWEQVGPLDINLLYAMDFDLWIRFSQEADFLYSNSPWAKFRLHTQGKSSTGSDRFWPEMRTVHKREGGRLISVFMGRYLLRKLFSPAWNWMRRKMSLISY